MSDALTPQRAANRLIKIAETFSEHFGLDRFPVDVPPLAKEAATIFQWSDPITEIQAADLKSFEGALFPNDGKTAWLLLYNSQVTSYGRIRFTQAHELGHYILHRQLKDAFECTAADMREWSQTDRNIEAQADLFASFLLMPLDDYRKQTNTYVDLDVLGHCANRYGVSLTAATLKWLEHTEESAVVVISRDGFVDWSRSSARAIYAGAFFKTSSNIIPIPDNSLAANTSITQDRKGIEIRAQTWFPNADPKTTLREMKLYSAQYGLVFTLLRLPKSATVWPPYKTSLE